MVNVVNTNNGEIVDATRCVTVINIHQSHCITLIWEHRQGAQRFMYSSLPRNEIILPDTDSGVIGVEDSVADSASKPSR